MPGQKPQRLSSTGNGVGSADGTEFRSPPRPEVSAFHSEADTDGDVGALHHTLGPAQAQAAPGDHSHDGGSSAPLFQGGAISGSRGTTAYFQSLEALLVSKGAQNQAV